MKLLYATADRTPAIRLIINRPNLLITIQIIKFTKNTIKSHVIADPKKNISKHTQELTLTDISKMYFLLTKNICILKR